MSKTRILTILIGMLPLLMVLGNSMLIPILPEFEEALSLTSAQTSLMLSIFSIPAALVIPFVGFLSDRFGRKRLIIISLLFIMIGGILCIFSGLMKYPEGYYLLLTGRFIQGLGTGGTTPLAMALIGDLFEGEQRSKELGILEVFNGAAKVVAPIIGALLALLTWYSPFFVFPIIGCLTLIGITMFVKTASAGISRQSLPGYLSGIRRVIGREKNWLFSTYFYGGTGMFLLFGMLYYLSYLIQQTYHIDGFFKGFVFSFPLGALTISSYWTGKQIKTDHLIIKKLMLIGSGLLCLAFFFLLFFHTVPPLLFFVTIGFGGLGFILPCINTLITSSVDDAERGFVVGVYGVARFTGVALGPIVFSSWMSDSGSMFIYMYIILVFAQITYWWSQYHTGKATKRLAIKPFCKE
ncbi:MFS transporter [Metabacillus arenae]|uniref:MFS transporter n=1 Tax=Metabacillus arenae TaxID=2771434 RepID=A0A926RVV6_9BACI|nr:MFS transporter [Metabacillus arenae]MBD1378905.1 MFS transporter [Metabacillus arenae]